MAAIVRQLGELLKGGLLPALKETALPNLSLHPHSLPEQERTLTELQPTQLLELQPWGHWADASSEMLPKTEQGAWVSCPSAEAGNKGGQLAPIAAVGFVQ